MHEPRSSSIDVKSPGDLTVDVAIIGAGPAGLAAAIELRRHGVARVLVIERETEAGGIPRHSHHTGYGLRDLKRVLTGPEYATHYRREAERAGAAILTQSMATGWTDAQELEVTSPGGRRRVRASATILATGARERPRPARLVPGDRAAGIYTTGLLQQAVYLRRQHVGRRAVVVGAEHVSFSAAMTLRHAGVEVRAMLTDEPRHQSFTAFAIGARLGLRVPLVTNTKVVSIEGRERVRSIVTKNLLTDKIASISCDTIVFTGDWMPDHELARMVGADLDRGTRGPAVDQDAATSVAGIFAAGNLCHPVETADVAALNGRSAGTRVAEYLTSRMDGTSQPRSVPIELDPRLLWVFPQRVSSVTEAPANDRYVLRSRVFHRMPLLTVSQGSRVLWQGRRRQLVPTRPTTLPADWQQQVQLDGPAVKVHIGEP